MTPRPWLLAFCASCVGVQPLAAQVSDLEACESSTLARAGLVSEASRVGTLERGRAAVEAFELPAGCVTWLIHASGELGRLEAITLDDAGELRARARFTEATSHVDCDPEPRRVHLALRAPRGHGVFRVALIVAPPGRLELACAPLSVLPLPPAPELGPALASGAARRLERRVSRDSLPVVERRSGGGALSVAEGGCQRILVEGDGPLRVRAVRPNGERLGADERGARSVDLAYCAEGPHVIEVAGDEVELARVRLPNPPSPWPRRGSAARLASFGDARGLVPRTARAVAAGPSAPISLRFELDAGCHVFGAALEEGPEGLAHRLWLDRGDAHPTRVAEGLDPVVIDCDEAPRTVSVGLRPARRARMRVLHAGEPAR